MFLAHVLSPRALTGASLAPKLRLGNSAGLPDISEELIPAGKVYMRGLAVPNILRLEGKWAV